MPADLLPHLQAGELDGAVAVQARQTLEESRWLLQLAEGSPHVMGVVGWVDLRSEQLETQLEQLAAHPKFVGVRHVAQDEPDDRFLMLPEVLQGIARLGSFGLTYDILIFPRQLPAAIELARRLPEQPFVLDHLAKPRFAEQDFETWRRLVHELAGSPNVMCKVSGMVTEADWRHWKAEDFRVGMETVLECFGAERLMFGSDWPVCLAAASYEQVLDLPTAFFGGLSSDEQAAIFGGNAAKFYGLEAR